MRAEGAVALRRSYARIAVALLAALTVGAVLIVLSSAMDVEGEVFTREPQALGGLAWYAGFLSTLGVLIWIAGASAVVALALNSHSPRDRPAFMAAAAIAVAMALDDIYLLHDAVYPLPESVVQLAYFVAISAIVVTHRRVLRGSAVIGTVCAVGLWMASAATDVLFNSSAINFDQLTEDTLKFGGIVVWTVGWVSAAVTSGRGLVGPANAPHLPGNRYEDAVR